MPDAMRLFIEINYSYWSRFVPLHYHRAIDKSMVSSNQLAIIPHGDYNKQVIDVSVTLSPRDSSSKIRACLDLCGDLQWVLPLQQEQFMVHNNVPIGLACVACNYTHKSISQSASSDLLSHHRRMKANSRTITVGNHIICLPPIHPIVHFSPQTNCFVIGRSPG